jgi:hypothetical protein
MGFRMRRYAASGSASRFERFLLDATPPIIAVRRIGSRATR